MRKLPVTLALFRFYLHVIYVRGRLLADAEAADLAAQLDAVRNRLREIKQAEEELELSEVEAMAVRDHQDGLLDRLLQRINRWALDRVNGDRKNPWYRVLFPLAVSRVIRWALGDEIVESQRLVTELNKVTDRAGAADPQASALATSLNDQTTATRTAITTVEGVATRATSIRADVVMAKHRVNEIMVVLHGQLQERFPMDRDRVRSYFESPVVRGLRGGRAVSVEEEEPAPIPEPPA
jgi:hypothetical protein